MKHFSKFFVVAIFLTIAGTASADFTSQQATDLVLNQVLSGELDHVDVFMIDNAVQDEDTIFLENHDTIVLPYSSNCVFFVDDHPFANWAHPCRFIFVDESTGSYQAVNKNFFPVDWHSAYVTLSEMVRPTGVDLPVNPNQTINGMDSNPNLYAVLICGYDELRFWNDISAIYCTLLNVYGYTKENIIVLYSDGTSFRGEDLDNDEIDDIDNNADKWTVYSTFQDLSGQLGPEDGLFIYIDGHRGRD